MARRSIPRCWSDPTEAESAATTKSIWCRSASSCHGLSACLRKKVSTEAGDFEAGRNAVVSRLDGHEVGVLHLLRIRFPELYRRFADSGAQVLFNISNDSWFGKTAARYQHLLIVRMRAAENERWIVRATNDGITAAIDPAGRVLRSRVPEYQELAARSLTGIAAI